MASRIRRPRHRDFDGLARDRLDRTKFDLGVAVAPGLYESFTFTADNATNTIVLTGQDGLLLSRVLFNGDDLPEGIEEGTLYFLRRTALDTYTLHLSEREVAFAENTVTFSDDGSGPATLTIFED